MRQFAVRYTAGIAVCLLILGVSACTKRVPVADGTFEAQQFVRLTFKDGRVLQGRIAPGNQAEYVDHGASYKARITSVDENEIVLGDAVLINQEGSYRLVGERLADARKQISAPLPAVTISRKDLEKVELVKVDAGKSVRRSIFWTYGGALLVLLLSERS